MDVFFSSILHSLNLVWGSQCRLKAPEMTQLQALVPPPTPHPPDSIPKSSLQIKRNEKRKSQTRVGDQSRVC